MAKSKWKSRKRKEQTIAIVIVAAVVLIVTAVILLIVANNNSELGAHDRDNDSESNQATELTLKVSVDAYEGETHYNAAVKFEEQIENRTGGAVQVEVYAKGKLGENNALIKALEENADVVDIVIAPVSDFIEVDARMDISTLPFMFESADDAWNFMSGDIQSEIESNLLNKNMRVLTHYAGEMTCVVSADKVVNNASDVTNMTLAENENDLGNVLQLMNARSVAMDTQTVYQALQQKQIDGYMGSLSDIYNNHLYQKQTYLAVTYHSYEGLAFVISEDTWKQLGEYQDVVEEIAKSSAYTDKDLVEQQERDMLERIKATGVRILYPDMSSFAEKAESYLRNSSEKYGTLIERHIINQKMNK